MRRERDSNPRRCDPQRFSRPPHSTALPSLRRKNKGTGVTNKIIFNFLRELQLLQVRCAAIRTTTLLFCIKASRCELRAASNTKYHQEALKKNLISYTFGSFSFTTTKSSIATCMGSRPIFTTAFFPLSSSTSPTCRFRFIFTVSPTLMSAWISS